MRSSPGGQELWHDRCNLQPWCKEPSVSEVLKHTVGALVIYQTIKYQKKGSPKNSIGNFEDPNNIASI